MKKRNLLVLSIISTVVLVLSGFLFYQGLAPIFQKSEIVKEQIKEKGEETKDTILGEKVQPSDSSSRQEVEVSRVIDGDTIEVQINNQKFSIRLIGIDTPESVDPRRPIECFGKEASLEAKRLLEGKKVYLEKDVSEVDKYSRLLRYVYLPISDGSLLFVNDYLIRQGFGNVLTYPPDIKYVDRFLEAQEEARENSRGLWERCRK